MMTHEYESRFDHHHEKPPRNDGIFAFVAIAIVGILGYLIYMAGMVVK